MVIKRKPVVAVATAAALVSLAACGGGGSSSDDGGSNKVDSSAKGGTVYYLTKRPTEHLDPQRTYIGRDIVDFNRLVYRGLVSFPVTTEKGKTVAPVADLATDTGKSSDGSKQWSFTLKDGVKWEDGKDITCADLKYGVSRSFATDVITGGPNYILGFLDVPHGKDGLPLYNGPYKKAHQADFDKAVTCSSDNKTITYKFNKPFPDFPLAVASLLAFDPYRQDKDQGDKSNYAVFSSGPYKLQGKWNVTTGGTFVRNSNWDAKSDKIRKALPDKFVFTQGLTNEVINDRLISDSGNDQSAITDRAIPPAFYTRINNAVKPRTTLIDSPFTEYLLPNFKRIKNLKVRQALQQATDAQGWINAGGGEKAYKSAKSLVNPSLIGYQDNPNFTQPAAGDPTAAKKLLQQSGEQMPYPIKFTYPGGTPTSDKQAAALKDTWQKAGFKVTLDPLTDTFYDIIQKPTNDSDVIYGGWGADWPSIATVLPPLFDSRINLTKASNGQDYGNYKSDAANKLIDEAANQTSVEDAGKIYAQLDDQLGKDVAYIPITIIRNYYLRGSKIANYVQSSVSSGYPDLAAIGVKK